MRQRDRLRVTEPRTLAEIDTQSHTHTHFNSFTHKHGQILAIKKKNGYRIVGQTTRCKHVGGYGLIFQPIPSFQRATVVEESFYITLNDLSPMGSGALLLFISITRPSKRKIWMNWNDGYSDICQFLSLYPLAIHMFNIKNPRRIEFIVAICNCE